MSSVADHGDSDTAMYEVPGSRLRELGEAERERDRLLKAIEDHRAVAPSRNHASPADYELWEALDA